MPFRKDIELPSGATARHWRIGHMSVDFIAMSLRVNVAGYTSKTNYLAGKAPLTYFESDYNGAEFPLPASGNYDLIGLVEAKVLADPYFAGSIAD